MVDFLGNKLNVGDTVVFLYPNYKKLVKGEVVKVTDKSAMVTRLGDSYGRRRLSHQIVKVV